MARRLDIGKLVVDLDRDIVKMANWAVNTGRVCACYMDAEDMAQEARLRLLEVLGSSYDPDRGDLKRYAMVLAYRAMANMSGRMLKQQRGGGVRDLRIVGKLEPGQSTSDFVEESMLGSQDERDVIAERDMEISMTGFSELDEGWRSMLRVLECGGLRDASRALGTTSVRLRESVERLMKRILPEDLCESVTGMGVE